MRKCRLFVLPAVFVAVFVLAPSPIQGAVSRETLAPSAAPDSASSVDPAAAVIYDQMIQQVAQAKTVTWESTYQFFVGGVLQGSCTYRIWMKKPGYARLEAMQGGKVTGVLIGDGRCFWIYWPEGRPQWDSADPNAPLLKNQYIQDLIPANRYSIAHRVSMLGTGMVMLAFQPTVFHGMPDRLRDSQQGMRLVREEPVAGDPCDVVEILMMDGQRSRTFWISRRDRLPRKITETAHLAQDITVTEAWSNVRRNGRISDELFRWAPPDDWTQYYEPALMSGLLPVGTPAPDLDLPLDGGGRFRLSAMKGKTVLLNFWRIGCPPCRAEVPLLQELYTQNANLDFVVVGVNVADDPKRVRDFLARCGATFPSVVDTSRAAVEAVSSYETIPGRRAVPLSYIIDAAGNVAGGWYGYDAASSPRWVRGELAKVGVR